MPFSVLQPVALAPEAIAFPTRETVTVPSGFVIVPIDFAGPYFTRNLSDVAHGSGAVIGNHLGFHAAPSRLTRTR